MIYLFLHIDGLHASRLSPSCQAQRSIKEEHVASERHTLLFSNFFDLKLSLAFLVSTWYLEARARMTRLPALPDFHPHPPTLLPISLPCRLPRLKAKSCLVSVPPSQSLLKAHLSLLSTMTWSKAPCTLSRLEMFPLRSLKVHLCPDCLMQTIDSILALF